MSRAKIATLHVAFFTLGAIAAPAIAAPDWSKVPAKKITLFFPGTASLEWTLLGSDHSGGRALRNKENCAGCHDKEAADIGQKVVSGALKALEAAPIKGKPGSIPISVQATHDKTNLYVRVQWKDPKMTTGKKIDQKNEVKLAMMVDAGKVLFGPEGGCWATCHHDLRSMPDVDPNAAKHPKAKELDIRSNGPTKYLRESRTELELKNAPRGGWNKLKPDAEIAKALKDGQFLDMMQFRSAAPPRKGYVLDARRLKEAPGIAEGKREGDTWTVTFTRKLATGEAGDHVIEAGKTYTVGFAIHNDYSDWRYHHVSLDYKLALDNPKVDINAVKQ